MSMWDGFNHRKFPRINLRCEIQIQPDTLTKSILTVTQNVGAGGVRVILDRPLQRFSKCRIRLHLKEKTSPIDCSGKIVWTVPTREMKSTKKKFDTGIEFLDMEPSNSRKIREFLDDFTQKTP